MDSARSAKASWSKHAVQRVTAHGTIAWYNNLTFQVSIIPPEYADYWAVPVEELPKVVRERLESLNILVPAGADESAYEKLLDQHRRQQGDPNLAYIITSQACNLRCSYCMVDEITSMASMPKRIMSPVVAKRVANQIADYVQASGCSEFDIMFYGGEPTMGWEAIKTIVLQLAPLHCVRFHLVTNGTLLTRSRAEFIRQYGISVGVSLDGAAPVTDTHRRFAGPKKSVYASAKEGLELLRSVGVDAGVSVTLSDIENTAEDLLHWLATEDIGTPFFNILHGDSESESLQAEVAAQTEFLLDNRQFFMEHGWREDRVDRKLDAIKSNVFYHADCPAVMGGQVTILPNGGVGVCQVEASNAEQTILGNILTGRLTDIIEGAVEWRDWQNVGPLFRDECRRCPALALCGGGCPAEAKALFGDHSSVDRPFCVHTLTILDWLLDSFADAVASRPAMRGGDSHGN